MTLAMVRCSIEADQGGTVSARARVAKFGKLGGRKSCSVVCVVYDSTRLSGCEVHGPSTTATI